MLNFPDYLIFKNHVPNKTHTFQLVDISHKSILKYRVLFHQFLKKHVSCSVSLPTNRILLTISPWCSFVPEISCKLLIRSGRLFRSDFILWRKCLLSVNLYLLCALEKRIYSLFSRYKVVFISVRFTSLIMFLCLLMPYVSYPGLRKVN